MDAAIEILCAVEQGNVAGVIEDVMIAPGGLDVNMHSVGSSDLKLNCASGLDTLSRREVQVLPDFGIDGEEPGLG